MTKFIALALMLTSLSSFAKEVKVECKFVDGEYGRYTHQFATDFTFDDEETEFSALDLTLTTRKAGREGTLEVTNVSRSGTIRTIAAGELARQEIKILTSTNRNDDLVYVNLVVNYPGNYNSTIRFKNDFAYKGTCKSK